MGNSNFLKLVDWIQYGDFDSLFHEVCCNPCDRECDDNNGKEKPCPMLDLTTTVADLICKETKVFMGNLAKEWIKGSVE